MRPVSHRTMDSDPILEAVQANLRMSGPDPAEIASLAAAGQAKAGAADHVGDGVFDG